MSRSFSSTAPWHSRPCVRNSICGVRAAGVSDVDWNMTTLVPELADLPAGICAGELVALVDGHPSFDTVCR